MSRVSGLAERIRLLVLQGELGPGELLVEQQLMAGFAVRRSTLREALRLLEGRGLLLADHSGGMRVVTVDEPARGEALRLRGALEALGAEAAAQRGGAPAGREHDALRALAASADAAVPGRDPRGALVADRTFHLALHRLADLPLAHDALQRTWDRLLVAGAPMPASPGGHARLVDAVAAGDAEAAAALARRHAQH